MEGIKIKKLLFESYSVKQMIGYIVVGYDNAESRTDIKSILDSITLTIIKIDKNKILDMIDIKLIEDIEFYWNLTLEQIIAYAYILFKTLFKCGKEYSINEIVSEFKQIARLYSPNNAEEYIENDNSILF